MDINTLAAWGEFIGGIAVVVSLVYLASQIRQNSKLLRASTANTTYQSNSTSSSFIIQDPEIARIYFAGLASPAALSEADRQRFDTLIGLTLAGTQQQFRLARDGSISPEVWADVEIPTRWFATQPGFREWWSEWSGQMLGAPFRAYVDGLIREGEADG